MGDGVVRMVLVGAAWAGRRRMILSGEVWRIKDGGGGSRGRWIEGQRGRRQATEAVGPRSASGGSDS